MYIHKHVLQALTFNAKRLEPKGYYIAEIISEGEFKGGLAAAWLSDSSEGNEPKYNGQLLIINLEEVEDV